METFQVKTSRRTQLVDVTRQVEKALEEAGAKDGVCYVFVPHTTAGVMINEHADPDVASDLEGIFDRLVPHKGPYRHAEGNTDSHAKTVMTGTSRWYLWSTGNWRWGPGRGYFCVNLMGRESGRSG